MPRTISSVEQFELIKAKAIEARIVRNDQKVKLKLRTPKYLYTYITNADEAQDLVKGIKDIEVVDYSTQLKEEKDSEKKKDTSQKESGSKK